MLEICDVRHTVFECNLVTAQLENDFVTMLLCYRRTALIITLESENLYTHAESTDGCQLFRRDSLGRSTYYADTVIINMASPRSPSHPISLSLRLMHPLDRRRL